MDDPTWQDRIIGDRMAVDRSFAPRVEASRFSSSQWGLIMAAVEFYIDRPETPDSAEVSAETSNLPSVIPELDRVERRMIGHETASSGNSSVLDSIRRLFFGGDADVVDDEALHAAEALVEDYATALQAHLREQGKWESVCGAAAGE